MKRALLLAAALAMPSIARADHVLHPPGGPVLVSDDADAAGPRRAPRDPAARARRDKLRRLLAAELDVDGDGRLSPRERMRGIRILRRIEHELAGGRGRAAKLRRFIERYDANGDGNVEPDEVPRGAARKLRRFDRDRDGWVEPRELPR